MQKIWPLFTMLSAEAKNLIVLFTEWRASTSGTISGHKLVPEQLRRSGSGPNFESFEFRSEWTIITVALVLSC